MNTRKQSKRVPILIAEENHMALKAHAASMGLKLAEVGDLAVSLFLMAPQKAKRSRKSIRRS